MKNISTERDKKIRTKNYTIVERKEIVHTNWTQNRDFKHLLRIDYQ